MPDHCIDATLIFAPGESAALGSEIARFAGLSLAALEERHFESGEFKLRPLVTVRDRASCVIQSLAATESAGVADRFVRLLFLLSVLRDAGACERIAIVPYLAYARKDRRTQVRDPVHTRYAAQQLEAAGLTRLVALDVHNPAALDNAFRVPVDHLSALPLFAAHLAPTLQEVPVTVASPDVGGIKRVQLFREHLERCIGHAVDLAFMEKRRVAGTVSGEALVGPVGQRHVIVLDDLCASGATLMRAARVAARAGAASVTAVVTHAAYRAGVEALIGCPEISRIVLTDSTQQSWHASLAPPEGRVELLSVAPLLGAALGRIARSASMAPLLEQWPPPDIAP